MSVPDAMTTAQHQDFDLKVVAGQWPDDIAGDMVFSSTAEQSRPALRHLRLGRDRRLSLDPRPARRRPGPVRVAGAVHPDAGQAALRCPTPSVFTPGLLGYTSPFGAPNSSNTAPLPWGERLYTTWDAGRPVELHPETMEFVAEVGHIDSWGGPSMFEGRRAAVPVLHRPSGGRPRAPLPLDREARAGHGAHVRDAAVGRPLRPRRGQRRSATGRSTASRSPGSIHTVSQTRDWVILCDSGNFKADAGEMFGGERTVTIDHRGSGLADPQGAAARA